jgi:hypothetical protein
MNPFVERHQGDISGVLSCFARVVITGTLPAIAHAGAMTGLLGYLGIRVFDYTQWAEPLREALRACAPTDSSRRSPTATSTTSPSWVNASWSPPWSSASTSCNPPWSATRYELFACLFKISGVRD